MKRRNLIYTLLVMLLGIAACDKPKDFYDDLGKGTYLTLVSSATELDGTKPAATVSQVVNKNGDSVKSVKIYAATTSTLDKTKWKLVKEVPFAGNTELKVSNTELSTALGLTAGQLPPGTVYYLYNEVIAEDGKVFNAINISAADLENQLAFNVAFRWTATIVCPYDATKIAGTYTVVRDDWEENGGWAVGDKVEVIAGPGANQFSLEKVFPNPAWGTKVNNLIVTVNPTTGALTLPAGLIWGDFGAYKGQTGNGSTGYVFSCQNKIDINQRISAPPFGDQGFFKIILQK